MQNKRISYDYMFNYFGGDTRQGKVVGGASVSLNIRPYKDGKEVLFEEGDEAEAGGNYLSDVFDVSFNRENQFTVTKNLYMDNLFRIIRGWERIEAEVVGYYLYVEGGKVGDEENELPEEFQNVPVLDPVAVEESEFRSFLSAHVDEFDISDNVCAQVPSVGFYDVPA